MLMSIFILVQVMFGSIQLNLLTISPFADVSHVSFVMTCSEHPLLTCFSCPPVSVNLTVCDTYMIKPLHSYNLWLLLYILSSFFTCYLLLARFVGLNVRTVNRRSFIRFIITWAKILMA